MEKLTYVTGNYGKYVSAKEKFLRAGLEIEYFKCDLEEPEVDDIEVISREKAREAYMQLGSPVFVQDSGFYIENYPGKPGYPGVFAKRSGVSSNIERLLEDMKDVEDRSCYFMECLTFYDGNEFYQFYGFSRGTLAVEMRGHKEKRALSRLWYVFIPNNCSKTLAEMNDEERINRPDGRTSATLEFIEWYKENRMGCKRLQFREVNKSNLHS